MRRMSSPARERGSKTAAQRRRSSADASLGDRVEQAIEEHAHAELEIEHGEREAASRGPSLRRSAVWLAITGISLYLVAPSLLDVLGSWRDLERIDRLWFPAMLALQAAALGCLWALQRMALHRARWPDVIESQLAGNALGKIAPAGGAIGAAHDMPLVCRKRPATAATISRRRATGS